MYLTEKRISSVYSRKRPDLSRDCVEALVQVTQVATQLADQKIIKVDEFLPWRYTQH
jgi:hypothetical protein